MLFKIGLESLFINFYYANIDALLLLSPQLVVVIGQNVCIRKTLRIIAKCHHYFNSTFNNFSFLMKWWTVKVVHCWALPFHLWVTVCHPWPHHLWVTISHPWPHHLLWQDCWWNFSTLASPSFLFVSINIC